MSAAAVGLLVSIALGFAAFFGGFWAFLLVLVLGAVGLVLGLVAQGDVQRSDFRPRGRQ